MSKGGRDRLDEVEKGRTFHFLSRSETDGGRDGGSEGNFCGEEKNSIVGVVGRPHTRARGPLRRRRRLSAE